MAASTRNAEAHAQLRNDILTGHLKPEQKLAFAVLCEQYGVSVGVMREALSRLAEQGLVDNIPQQGFYVARISVEDLLYLTEARTVIEKAAMRHAIESGSLAWESEVVAANHRLTNTPRPDPNDPTRLSEEWAQLHSQFHEILLSGCPNTRLLAVASQLRDSADMYRRWSFPQSPGPARDINREHREIVDAVVSRDADLAVALVTAHTELTVKLQLESIAGDAEPVTEPIAEPAS